MDNALYLQQINLNIMTSIKFPENRISERVRKTLEEYHDEIMRGWNEEMKETELPPFLPHDTGEIMIVEGVF